MLFSSRCIGAGVFLGKKTLNGCKTKLRIGILNFSGVIWKQQKKVIFREPNEDMVFQRALERLFALLLSS